MQNIKPTATLMVLSAALFLSACASVASLVYPLNENAAKARAGSYKLDPDHASVLFAVSHFGFSTFRGRFDTLSGSLNFDSENPEKSNVTIEIQTDSLHTGVGKLDALLLADDMFSSGGSPVIQFTSTEINQTSEKTGQIKGIVTVKGISKPVTLEARFIGSGTNPLTRDRTVGFSATTTIQRSAFGLKNWLPFVGDTVDITVDVEFVEKR